MAIEFPRIVIAALGGGLGKTTVTLGLAGTLRRNGIEVLPFKKGPDYIDAAWLSRACGRPCRNLDTYLAPASMVYEHFAAQANGQSMALIEGNRGLYDGVDDRGTFSTAELAKQLTAPLILVVNCSKVTRTVAAMVLGAKAFDPDAPLAGVILNHVATARQEAAIKRAIEDYCDLRVLGAVPRLSRPPLADRHLGVVPPEEDPDFEESLSWAMRVIEDHVDWRAILNLSREAPALAHVTSIERHGKPPSKRNVRIGILRDAAFQFYYPENIEALRALGAEIVPCSALHDSSLPKLDALYIGGGFPETCADALEANTSFRKSVKDAAESGLPIYAECGGLMYLGKSLEISDRQVPMAGVFDFGFRMESKPVAHGYTAFRVERENPFYPVGLTLRGHEFHYSRLVGYSENTQLVMSMQRGHGLHEKMEGFCHRNTLALYSHVHALGTPEWAEGIVQAACRFKQVR